MIKEWATVISWQQGIALLRCEPRAGCGSCHARGGCGGDLLNKLGPDSQHQLQVAIDQPLEPGQRIEVGISEGSLLRSAVLVYLTPLGGLILGGAVSQAFFVTELMTAMGAVIGGVGGFLLARKLATKLEGQSDYQPVVLQIGLPPTSLRIQQD
ncbi:SoxR-reducing system protein RseC [Yersinia ruckeri]|uniref:SoxR-reducing system protein RseC n=1 Tax=Yersinia ruckeri TaxID=29486 RepID=UPI00119D0B23|nr:SoxR-reducing system protein RseC [Yersinia ruckeri]EKN3346222.1 SoxR-reducing system protein RseC [Yersinia ruckeri]EKN4705305.1 SoxR-reducing system protein RseC [Yersinia ruckeri]ELM3746917.1 SoxR-reducing system protein RseC [Yersinia ruckeri]MCK8561995.1 SoxR-reducing system protein RseC [Yersinia ruckeri]MCW6548045.1 SoxR-reducing system protein RseC [Yersinia ruckeri]